MFAVGFRIATLLVSVRHEKALKEAGAVEFGRPNSILLGVLHGMFYFSALAEGLARRAQLTAVSWAGIALSLAGSAALVLVMRLLGRFWTVKLILARDHALQTHSLFRSFRHPNYYLAILPELAGFAVCLHAWLTLPLGLIAYAVPLAIRIREEEAAMRDRFTSY